MKEQIQKITTTQWIIAVSAILILLVIISKIGGSKTTGFSTPEMQKQIKESKDLAPFLASERNNFNPGNYDLDMNASSIEWKYDGKSGKLPISNGSLGVLNEKRIEGFKVSFDSKDLPFFEGDSNANISSSLVLPNDKDDAFSISLGLNTKTRSTSLAAGMIVKSGADGSIDISGSLTLDPKGQLQIATAKEKTYLEIIPHFVFK